MSSQTLLCLVDEVPVVRALNRDLIRLPEPAANWVFVASADELEASIDAALGGVAASVKPFEEETKAPVDARTHSDLRALARVMSVLLEGAPLVSESGYLQVAVRVVASSDRNAVRDRLEKAGLSVADLRSVMSPQRVSEEEALTRALAPFRESFSPAEVELVRDWLEGPPAPVPESIRAMRSDYYGEDPAGIISDVLSGAVERWNGIVSSKLLDLWIALRSPLATELRLGLGEDGLPPELGFDRARVLAEALTARGLQPALAAVAARSIEGQSTWFYAPTLLSTPEVFEEALKLDRELAHQLAYQAVPRMGLEDSQSVREHVRRFLASHSAALGPQALIDLVALEPEAIDEQHLQQAGGDLLEGCKLASKVQAFLPGSLRRANERIAALDPEPFARTLMRLLEREPELVDGEVAWGRVIACLEAEANRPFGDDEYIAFSLLERMPKPTAAHKATIGRLCSDKGDALGALRKKLEKLAGARPPRAPYKDEELAGLSAACAKAIKTARARSWEAGIELPKGASDKAIAKAEKALNAALPEDLRAFLALHDGGGPDESFNGTRLYGLRDALNKRKWLLEVEGAPFDATWLPITDDGAGNHACVVLSGKNAGAVFDFDHETGCGRRLAKSFAAFLQSGKWE